MVPPGYLPVHCCCEPGKRLGYLPVPQGDTLAVLLPPERRGDDMEPLRTATLRVRALHRQGEGRIVAFDSGHQPIEVLRKVPGWIDHA